VNDETEGRILKLLDAISVEVVAGRNDIQRLDVKLTELDVKVDRLDHRLGRVETRVEGVETELRSFRHEFERRISPLER